MQHKLGEGLTQTQLPFQSLSIVSSSLHCWLPAVVANKKTWKKTSKNVFIFTEVEP